ncbi:MAG: hypothetical protein LBF62_06500 [Tannerellaceae bacterium]|jgi:hypothetical protein|nr:hypothetical protein [Tannerellaceae bacterium]
MAKKLVTGCWKTVPERRCQKFEKKRQEVLLNRHLRDAACPSEAVSGSRYRKLA